MKTLRNKKDGFQVFTEALRRNEDFQNSTGSLSGRSRREVSGYGRLPASWREDLDRDKEGVEYVVYSYSTPIAWRKRGVWTVPDTRYSVTTSQHQGKIAAAISDL